MSLHVDQLVVTCDGEPGLGALRAKASVRGGVPLHRGARRISAVATRTELYDDQEITDAIPVIALGREALENARPRPVSPYYSDMSLRIAEQWSEVIRGNTDPQQAVQTLHQELQEIVDQAQS